MCCLNVLQQKAEKLQDLLNVTQYTVALSGNTRLTIPDNERAFKIGTWIAAQVVYKPWDGFVFDLCVVAK